MPIYRVSIHQISTRTLRHTYHVGRCQTLLDEVRTYTHHGHCFMLAHPAAEMAAQAKCPPFSDLGSKVSRSTGGCTSPSTPPPLFNLVPSSKLANSDDEKDQSCLGTSHKSRVWLCITRISRGSRARKATGTGGRGSIDLGPCCCNGVFMSVRSVVQRGFAEKRRAKDGSFQGKKAR